MAYIVNSDGEWIWEEPEEETPNVFRTPVEEIPPEPPARTFEPDWQNPRSEADWKEWEYRKKREIAAASANEKLTQETQWRADIKKNEKPLPVVGDEIPPMPPKEDIGGTATFRPAAANRKDGVRRFSNMPSDKGDVTVGYIDDTKQPISYGGVDDEFSKFHQHVINTQFDGKDPNLINPYIEADKLADPKIEPERNKTILDRLIKQKTVDISKLDYFDKMGLANIERQYKTKEKEVETTTKKTKAETEASKEMNENRVAILNGIAWLNQKKDGTGDPIVRSKEEIVLMNETIDGYKNRNNELLSQFPNLKSQITPKITLTPEQTTIAQQLNKQLLEQGVKDKNERIKIINSKLATAQTQSMATSKPQVKPVVKPVPIVPSEPPAEVIKPNPNKAKVINKPSLGEAYQKRFLGPTSAEEDAAWEEISGLATKLGVGRENWKAAGHIFKDAGQGAWLMYTNAINKALAGQRQTRADLMGAK